MGKRACSGTAPLTTNDELAAPDYRAARIHLQDLLVQRAAGVARREKFQEREVRKLFANGSVVMRLLALG